MAKRKASAKWFEEGDSHGAASKFGQLLGEAFADAVYRFIGRYLREHYPAYSLLKPAEGKKLVQLAMLGGTSRQMDSVIVPRDSTDPVALFESKWLKDGRHHNDKGAWILQLKEIRRKHPTVRGAVANLGGFWNEGARLMFEREGRVRMVLVATDEEVYGTLQPFVDQFANEHNTGAINLGNIRAIRDRLPEPWHLANCVGLLKEKGSLAEIADNWLDFERQQPAAESTVRGRDLVREAIDELLAPLPEDPRIESFELSLQISTGNIIHKEVADVEDAIEFI
ncbi:MAG: hypothetical protein JNL42_14500 [Anaerolineae bacterium]|nr:hypothetical protein [Anaerolineae bacterium]